MNDKCLPRHPFLNANFCVPRPPPGGFLAAPTPPGVFYDTRAEKIPNMRHGPREPQEDPQKHRRGRTIHCQYGSTDFQCSYFSGPPSAQNGPISKMSNDGPKSPKKGPRQPKKPQNRAQSCLNKAFQWFTRGRLKARQRTALPGPPQETAQQYFAFPGQRI